MMGSFLKRIGSIVLVAGGWLLAILRFALDLVGWSTVPDDVNVAMSRVDQFLTWLLSLPWEVPWGFALLSTLWLIWVSWPGARVFGAEFVSKHENSENDPEVVIPVIASDQILLSREEYDSLTNSNAKCNQMRKATARVEQLSRDLNDAERISVQHSNIAAKMTNLVATARFSDMDNPHGEWYDGIVQLNADMEMLRHHVNDLIKRLYGNTIDFSSTPITDDNPYSVSPPNIDRLPEEKFKYDYRRFYERLERANSVINNLPKNIKLEIDIEKRRIIELG